MEWLAFIEECIVVPKHAELLQTCESKRENGDYERQKLCETGKTNQAND